MKETDIIANIWSYSRGLTKWYLDKFNEQQLLYQPTAEGKVLHSPYWIVGHLAWTQNDLGIVATGGKSVELDWLNDFRWNNPENHDKEKLPYSAVYEGFEQVHRQAMEHIRNLSDEVLDEEVQDIFKTKRGNLYHCIRHEGVHTGHLGWLCKLNGIQTV